MQSKNITLTANIELALHRLLSEQKPHFRLERMPWKGGALVDATFAEDWSRIHEASQREFKP